MPPLLILAIGMFTILFMIAALRMNDSELRVFVKITDLAETEGLRCWAPPMAQFTMPARDTRYRMG